ncbi:MAG TPA: hypothetical protein VEQ42_13510, partial [Pyrinomonadaceae bacterium]|nr:hypothetical protein [Pyrinomonadaceae bacterium]
MTPRAEVEFRSREDGGRRELEVELENVNLPGGTSLDVLVDNVPAGSIVLDGDGRGEVRLRQDDGQNVPAMNLRSRLVVVNSSGATIVGGSFTNLDPANPTPQPSDGETRIIARLAGAALNNLAPKGKAEFRERSDRNRRKFKAEVERINLPAGTRLNVLVSGTKVGEIVVTQFLRGQLELDT